MIKKSQIILLVALMWIGHFCVDVMLGIWPVFKTLSSFNLATAGLMVSLGAFIGEGSQLLFGLLGDRGYRKYLLAFGVIVSSGAAFLAYTSGVLSMFALFLATCIGSGAFHPSAAAVVNSLSTTRKGLYMTIFASGGFLGMALSQIIFTHHYYIQQTYLIAIPVFVVGLATLLIKIPEIPHEGVTDKRHVNFGEFLGFFKRPELFSLYFAQVANQALLWGMIFILPDTLVCFGYHSWVCFGGGHLCFILGSVLMLIPSGYLADRYSAKRVMLISMSISVVLFYLILFANFSASITLVLLFILGGGIGVINPIGVALGNKYEPNKPGAISAFLMGLVWCASETIGPGGVGLVSTFFEDHAAVKALAILGLLFFVSLYFTARLPSDQSDCCLNKPLA